MSTRLVCPEELLARRSDVAQVARAAYRQAPWDEGPGQATGVLGRLARDAQAMTAAVVEIDGRVRGFAWVRTEPDLTLVELALDPAVHGLGLGRSLHDALTPVLDTGPARLLTHPRARAPLGLYRSRGWQVSQAPRPDRLLLERAPRLRQAA